MPPTAITMNAAELVKAISVFPILATGKRSMIWNCSIGSAAMGRRCALVGQMSVANDTCRPHHVKNPGGKAKQQKHNEPPRRDPEPAIEQPADYRTHDHARDQFGRQPKTAGHRRRIGGLTRTCGIFGRPAR